MRVSLKLLGVIAMLCSPFLWFETHFYTQAMHNTSLTGWCDLVYMIGWSCSIIGLITLDAAGDKPIGKAILYIQLAFLCIANIWNIWEIVDPLNETFLFRALDKFWPISNSFMAVVGIAVIVAKRLHGFYRFVPLLAGLWLPVTALLGMALRGRDPFYFIVNAYSVVTFFLLGLTIFLHDGHAAATNKRVVPSQAAH